MILGDRNRYENADTRVKLHADAESLELLAPLVIADAARFWETYDIDIEGPYRRFNSILSMRGHIQNNNILPALSYLFGNLDELRHLYGVTLPPEVRNQDAFMDHYKGPFSNITNFDIAHILHSHGALRESPRQIFENVERLKEGYRDLIIGSLNGHPPSYLVEANGMPAFGVNAISKIPIGADNLALWVTTAWSLGVNDSAYYRTLADVNEGCGINCAVNLKAMATTPVKGHRYDLKSLADFDTYEFLGLEPGTPPMEVYDLFFEKVWPLFIKAGITYDAVQTHGPGITDGYIRIMRGSSPVLEDRKKYGGADSMYNMIGGYLWGPVGFAGMVGGDAWDTAEGLGLNIYKGGHDSHFFEELMGIEKFRNAVAPFLERKMTDKIITWARETPPHEVANPEFIPPSCSQRYLNQVYRTNGHKSITALEMELWILMHLKHFLESDGVPREIPKYDLGFERVPSTIFVQNLYQKTKRWLKEGLFPEGSWIYKQVQ